MKTRLFYEKTLLAAISLAFFNKILCNVIQRKKNNPRIILITGLKKKKSKIKNIKISIFGFALRKKKGLNFLLIGKKNR